MKTMEEYAMAYWKEHRGKGSVTDVTDYSFKFTTHPQRRMSNLSLALLCLVISGIRNL